MIALRVLIAIFCLVWLTQTFVWVRNIRHLRRLVDSPVPDLGGWPRLSVIIPARNEADTIEAAVRTRMGDDYPDLELVIVDDRSEDATPAIAQRLAAEDPRITYVRIDELPQGWLGKVHALHRGMEHVTGEWVLLSDADVHVEPQAMKRAVGHCIKSEFQHLALVPEYQTNSWIVDSLWAVFMRIIGIMVDAKQVRDPNSKTIMGSGAFNLVKRDAFLQTEGFEWLRLETTDDVGVGILMRNAGFASEFMDGRGAASVLIYPDARAFLRGSEKNAGSVIGPPAWLLTIGALIWLTLELSPFIAILLGPLWLTSLGILTAVLATLITAGSLRINTGRVLAGLAWPVGSILFAAALIRAVWLVRINGGLRWRGTFYPREEILAARRWRLASQGVDGGAEPTGDSDA